MKNKYFIILLLIYLIVEININVNGQATSAVGTNSPLGAGEYLGWTLGTNLSLEINNQDAFPINLSTNNSQRMTILGSNNSPYVGLNNTGYIGIRTTAPPSPLTIQSDGSATGQIIPNSNWSNGIMIRNHGTLIFEGDRANFPANRDFFMAHPSFNPQGDYWEGLVPGIDGNPVQYVYRLYGRTVPGFPTQGEHEFFTNILADSRIGVNTLFPSQRTEIVDGNNIQLRLTNTQNTAIPANSIKTDFQTTGAGD